MKTNIWANVLFTKTTSWVFVVTQMLSGCGEKPAFNENAAGAAADVVASDQSSADEDKVGPDGVSSEDSQNTADNDSDNDKSVGNEIIKDLLLANETTTMVTQNDVDILWVVDSSGSMSEEQSYLGQNFNSFISQLSQSGINFQTGVTSTDICASTSPSQVPMAERYCPTLDGSSTTHHRGSLVGTAGKKVLKPGMNDLMSRFVSYANVGTNGSGFEHGLKAAEMAVTKSLNGQNEGLVRNSAFLAVVVVSDEEDDGIGLGKTDTYSGKNFVAEGLTSVHYTDDNLISFLNQAKGAGKFSVSTITGTKMANGSMCTSAHSKPREEGSQYIAAANKTGGIVQSICDTNWSASLASIGQDIAGQSNQTSLSHVAYDGSIKVYVNGVQNFDWTYSLGSNSIKFNAGKVPASGSSVNIKYYYEQ
jgi:hypothetical protein